MFSLTELKKEFEDCPCKKAHELTIKEIVAGSGITAETGEILKRNGFKKNLLLVADENTIAAAGGVTSALKNFNLKTRIYRDLREATVQEVENVKELLKETDGVISVGTGSLNDVCRKAAAETDKPLCVFATAASMDGFASYNAPLVNGNFKITYAAKSPEVIIGDTNILANSPSVLKGAGFGDMVGKYVGLIDWQVSSVITGEYYCERVAALTRRATDRIMRLSDRILAKDEESAEAVFEALLLTGIGMSFTKTSRPASGTEHILSHFWECKKLLKGELSDFHGRKVGVATLYILDLYKKLAQKPFVCAHKETTDWDEVYAVYGELADEVKALNTPDTITDGIAPEVIEENWDRIREIVASVPSVCEVRTAMEKAGAPLTTEEISVSDELKEEGLRYHPYMRRRLSLRRLANMID